MGLSAEQDPSGSTEVSRQFLVSEISVKNLFGKYNYRISPLTPEDAESGAPPIMLLYGQNGGGKTTVLNLLWHILSPANNKGHRTALGRIPFETCSIRLGNGDLVTVTHIEGNLIGPYDVRVTRGTEIVVDESYIYPQGVSGAVQSVDKARRAAMEKIAAAASGGKITSLKMSFGDVRQEPIFYGDNVSLTHAIFQETESSPYIDYLQLLDARLFLLNDERRLSADDPTEGRRRARERIRPGEEEDSPISVELGAALHKTSEWLRQQIFSGADAGSIGVDEVYRDVLNHLARESEPDDQPDVKELRKRISDLGERTERFNEFGLVTQLDTKPMLAVLNKVRQSRLGLVASILDPYLSGQTARMDSLQDTESLIRTFVKNVNSYLEDKYIIFKPRGGLQILSTDGDHLRPAQLSSGERQLLLLLCNALLARQSASLFLIDEPELSLNAKWQRKLVRTLLDCVDSTSVQFIMATHSIEIITRHRTYLARLDNERE